MDDKSAGTPTGDQPAKTPTRRRATRKKAAVQPPPAEQPADELPAAATIPSPAEPVTEPSVVAVRTADRPREAVRVGQPEDTKQRARTQFEKWALTYDRSWLNELVFFPTIRRCQTEIRRWQSGRNGRPFRMLDVGCGTGTLLALAARDERAELLVGLDYAEQMVRRCAEKFAGSPHADKLQVVRGDAERLPFVDGAFDVVTCCNSFHHYPEQIEALREFRRVLRPAGILILVDGFRDNVIGWLIFDVVVGLLEGRVHHAAWSEVDAMVRQAGFASLRQEKMNVLAPLLVNVAMA